MAPPPQKASAQRLQNTDPPNESKSNRRGFCIKVEGLAELGELPTNVLRHADLQLASFPTPTSWLDE